MENPPKDLPEPSLKDRSFRPAIYQLLQVSALMLKTREYYAEAVGVTPPQFSILAAVAESSGVSVGEVATRLHVSGPFVTAEVNKLVKRGLVEKAVSQQDRRVAELRITPECEARLAEVAPLREAANFAIFGHMSPAALAMFSETLVGLIGGLEDALHMLARPGRAR